MKNKNNVGNTSENSGFEYGCLLFQAARGNPEAKATIGKEIPQKW